MARNRIVISLVGGAMAVAGLVSTALNSRPAQAQLLSGFDVYRANCGGCHELYDPEDPKRTREQWDAVLTRMVRVRGATLNKQEYTAVLNYLDSFNRPKREIQWNESPAKSWKATFKPADSGKLPAEWVDLTIGADTVVPWAVQADQAKKAAFIGPLKSAGENQFPAVMDNTGVVESGSAATRLQLVSGKGAVGAGVIFGFKNPQSYYGVRVGPRDLVLYEVQGQRALLRRAPMAVPLKQWQTLEVAVSGKNVQVSLNGKPVAALTTTIPNYRGGRMGINTQGDTVAMFDQWSVTVK